MQDFIDRLEQVFRTTEGLASYRLTLTDRRGATIGIKDNQVGSVYSPLTFSATLSGAFLVQWEDGRVSKGSLDSSSLDLASQLITLAREGAYDDPDAAQFLAQQPQPQLELYDEGTALLASERPSRLLEIAGLLQREAQSLGVATLSGSAGAGETQREVRTSAGLRFHERSTNFGYSFYYDGRFGDGKSARIAEDDAAISERIANAAPLYQALRQPAGRRTSGEFLLVLHPQVSSSMLWHYLIDNLQGSAIAHGQSPFSAADFADGRVVLREDLTLRADPLRSFTSGSYGFSGEGVPAAPVTYIENGRLRNPILDLKYARKLGLQPTSSPSGAETLFLEGAPEIAWETLRPELDGAILVLSILGLHTQDRTSGSFSLSAPQALLIEGGVYAGATKATFRGSLFEALRSADLQLVRFPGQPLPGLTLRAQATLE